MLEIQLEPQQPLLRERLLGGFTRLVGSFIKGANCFMHNRKPYAVHAYVAYTLFWLLADFGSWLKGVFLCSAILVVIHDVIPQAGAAFVYTGGFNLPKPCGHCCPQGKGGWSSYMWNALFGDRCARHITDTRSFRLLILVILCTIFQILAISADYYVSDAIKDAKIDRLQHGLWYANMAVGHAEGETLYVNKQFYQLSKKLRYFDNLFNKLEEKEIGPQSKVAFVKAVHMALPEEFKVGIDLPQLPLPSSAEVAAPYQADFDDAFRRYCLGAAKALGDARPERPTKHGATKTHPFITYMRPMTAAVCSLRSDAELMRMLFLRLKVYLSGNHKRNVSEAQ
jgi:hypothetical protein